MTLSSRPAPASPDVEATGLVGAHRSELPTEQTTDGVGPEVRTRRERNKSEKQARILAAAQSLLGEVGYERMTTAEVAKRAHVAAGTVFQYAPTKAELLMMVVENEWRDIVTDSLPTEREQDGADVRCDVMRLLEPLAREARTHPHNAMVVGRELLFGAPGPYREKVVALVAELEEAIAGLLAAAGGESHRCAVAARLIVSGGVLELNRTRRGRADAESVAQRLQDLVDVAVRGAGV